MLDGAGDIQDVIEDVENPGSFIVLTEDGVLRLRPGETEAWILPSSASR